MKHLKKALDVTCMLRKANYNLKNTINGEQPNATKELSNKVLSVTCKQRKPNANLENITREQPDADLRLLTHTTSILVETSCNWVGMDTNQY